eukprot:3295243-Prymnesium_polylepis.1
MRRSPVLACRIGWRRTAMAICCPSRCSSPTHRTLTVAASASTRSARSATVAVVADSERFAAAAVLLRRASRLRAPGAPASAGSRYRMSALATSPPIAASCSTRRCPSPAAGASSSSDLSTCALRVSTSRLPSRRYRAAPTRTTPSSEQHCARYAAERRT